MSDTRDVRVALDQGRRRALIVGGIALVLTVVGAIFDLDRALQSWLFGWFFWLGLALGSLALLLLHSVTGGAWGFPIRRLLGAAARSVPLLALLFVPVLVFLERLYPWAVEGVLEEDGLIAHKEPYLNEPFFLVRTVVYFLVWIGLTALLRRLGERFEATRDPDDERRVRVFAGPALAVYVMTMTFASVDWAMSLEPHWFSTIYGVLFIVGQVLSALALAILGTSWMASRERYRERVTDRHFHDFGNLTFAFVMLWAYVSFSQYLIIWSANLAEETPWYLSRLGPGWQAISIVLLGFHFFVPFFVLLSRKAKRSRRMLGIVAGGLLLMRFLDLYWLIQPAFRPDGVGLHWLDVTAPIAVGGLWFAWFAGTLSKSQPLILEAPRPEADPEHLPGDGLEPSSEVSP